MIDDDDQALLGRLHRRRDHKAFESLFQRHYTQLCRIGTALVKTAQAAEDLAQETFLRLWRFPPKPDGRYTSILPWLVTVARNIVATTARRGQPDQIPLEDDLPLADPEATNTLDNVETAADLDDSLSTLPEDQRLILVMRYRAGMSYNDIAAVFGIAVDAVGARLRTAQKALYAAYAARLPQPKGTPHGC